MRDWLRKKVSPCLVNSRGEHGQMPGVCEATTISKFELLNQNEATGF